MAVVIPENRKFWTEFIRLYKSLPCLWMSKYSKCDTYRDKNLKMKAYDKLAEKLLEIDQTANHDKVRRKLNSLRASYRREMLRVKASEETAETEEDIHKPSLWFYNEMDSFLRNCASLQQSDNLNESERNLEETEITDPDPIVEERRVFKKVIKRQSQPITYKTPPKRLIIESIETIQTPTTSTTPQSVQQKTSILQTPEHSKNPQPIYEPLQLKTSTPEDLEDESIYLGKIWGLQYKKLREDQKLYAKKAIDDILFEGLLGTLHRKSVAINTTEYEGIAEFTNTRDEDHEAEEAVEEFYLEEYDDNN